MILENAYKQLFELERNITGGNKGHVWTIKKHPDKVAKIYHHPTINHELKIMTMIDNTPKKHVDFPNVAWANNVLYHQDVFI